MKLLAVTILLAVSLIEARPQNPADGKYYPELFGHNLGYYQHDDSGHYVHDNSGAFRASSSGNSGFGGSQFGAQTSGSKFGSQTSDSRFNSAQTGVRGGFGSSSTSSFGGSSNGGSSQHSSVVSTGPNSQFVSNSVHHSSSSHNGGQNGNAIAAIGISSSFLPPLADDSEEFGGFLPNTVSTSGFTSTSNNFGGTGGSVFSSSGKGTGVSSFASHSSGFGSNSGKTGQGQKSTQKTSFGGSTKTGFGSSSKSGQNSAFGGARLTSSTGPSDFGQNYANAYGDYKIVRQDGTIDEDGYHYLYETENNIQAEETGRLANKGTDDEHIKANGFYEYVGTDGVTYRVDYTADENGFQPVGAHLPVGPPIPEAIQRALDAQGITFP